MCWETPSTGEMIRSGAFLVDEPSITTNCHKLGNSNKPELGHQCGIIEI
jgi:hypothetical protein